jgi:hypothetical protein
MAAAVVAAKPTTASAALSDQSLEEQLKVSAAEYRNFVL